MRRTLSPPSPRLAPPRRHGTGDRSRGGTAGFDVGGPGSARNRRKVPRDASPRHSAGSLQISARRLVQLFVIEGLPAVDVASGRRMARCENGVQPRSTAPSRYPARLEASGMGREDL